jgi:Transposase DDE domain
MSRRLNPGRSSTYQTEEAVQTRGASSALLGHPVGRGRWLDIVCDPDKMRVRRQTVEHPFGTIKAWMGATHFQMRRLPKVASEMALNVLAYNMKRVIQILGVAGLMAAMRA